jgi:sec-independent protein translocase protein TatB
MKFTQGGINLYVGQWIQAQTDVKSGEVKRVRIGMTELIVIFVVALFVVGPDRLPMYAKKLGEALAQFKKYSDDATKDIKKSIVEPLEEAQRPLKEAIEPLSELDKAVRDNVKDVQDSLNSIGKPKKKTAAKKDAEKPEDEAETADETEPENTASHEDKAEPENTANIEDEAETDNTGTPGDDAESENVADIEDEVKLENTASSETEASPENDTLPADEISNDELQQTDNITN